MQCETSFGPWSIGVYNSFDTVLLNYVHLAFFLFFWEVSSVQLARVLFTIMMIYISTADTVHSWNIYGQDLEGYQSEGVSV
jgi:hypothetical protein